MVINRSFIFTVAFTLILSVVAVAQVTPLPATKHKTIVIAHRGDHTHAPENTLAAYQNTIEDGADFVEIDLRTTKDSQLVIMHNATIDHMTAQQGEIKSFTLDALRKIKVREPLHPEWGMHTIPTFKEVLQLCKGKINVYLDFKDASVAQTYQEIIDAGMENNIVVYINEPHQFEEWGTIAPNMPLMISLPKAVKTTTEMNEVLHTFDIDILDGDYTEYNPETVAAATQKHIPIWADVQSKEEGPDQWNAALKLGLAGMQSDHPKALIDFLIQKGMR
jgi:glycerophosphoryl diester phosphodiesterase